MIKIALVDDHQLFRKSMAMLLSTFEGISVVHDTDDGMAFLDYTTTSQIDVVLLDIQMPIIDGYELCKRLRTTQPELKILIVSQLTSKEAIHQIMSCGAHGFFTKNASPELLEIAIKNVMAFDYYFDISLDAVIREAILWEKKASDNEKTQSRVALSAREIEIIKLVCHEMNSKQIAEILNISTRTVETHRKRIMEKTAAKNFIGAILYALKTNTLKLSDI